jgi:hypothetical protein
MTKFYGWTLFALAAAILLSATMVFAQSFGYVKVINYTQSQIVLSVDGENRCTAPVSGTCTTQVEEGSHMFRATATRDGSYQESSHYIAGDGNVNPWAICDTTTEQQYCK